MKVLQVALALLVLPSSTEAHRRGGPRTKATEEQHRVQGPRGKAAKESRTKATKQHRAKMFVPEAAKKKQAERAAVKMFVPEFAKKKQAERAAVSAHQTKVKSAPQCVTDKDWYDIDGEEYDCDWYAEYPQWRCIKFGSCFENFGKTANQACCVCDEWIGKAIDEDTEIPDDYEYEYMPNILTDGDYYYDACAPDNDLEEDKCASEYGIVTDKDWYDIDGEEYDCDWYAEYAQWRCGKFGSCFENFGKTANQACCFCAEWIGKAIGEDTEIPDDYEYQYMPNGFTDGDYYYDACAPDNNDDNCVPVNHQYDHPGEVTCDCVSPDDPCLTDMGEHGPHCIPDESCEGHMPDEPDYCVPVNHQYDHPGEVTCDCVLPDDPCLTDMGEHGPHCIPDESCEGHMPDDPDYEVKSNSEMGAQTAEK